MVASRPNHLTADELATLVSGHHCPRNHHQPTRRRLAVLTRPAALALVLRSTIPANSGEAPPLFWSPESLRRRPLTWLAWGHPRATASGPCGS